MAYLRLGWLSTPNPKPNQRVPRLRQRARPGRAASVAAAAARGRVLPAAGARRPQRRRQAASQVAAEAAAGRRARLRLAKVGLGLPSPQVHPHPSCPHPSGGARLHAQRGQLVGRRGGQLHPAAGSEVAVADTFTQLLRLSRARFELLEEARPALACQLYRLVVQSNQQAVDDYRMAEVTSSACCGGQSPRLRTCSGRRRARRRRRSPRVARAVAVGCEAAQPQWASRAARAACVRARACRARRRSSSGSSCFSTRADAPAKRAACLRRGARTACPRRGRSLRSSPARCLPCRLCPPRPRRRPRGRAQARWRARGAATASPPIWSRTATRGAALLPEAGCPPSRPRRDRRRLATWSRDSTGWAGTHSSCPASTPMNPPTPMIQETHSTTIGIHRLAFLPL